MAFTEVAIYDVSSSYNDELAYRLAPYMEQLGLAALAVQFPGRSEHERRQRFDPENAELVERRARTISLLGDTGICLAAFAKDTDIQTAPDELLGFGLLRRRNATILPRFIADKLRSTDDGAFMELYVDPTHSGEKIGAQLLRNMAHEAFSHKLLNKPAITVHSDFQPQQALHFWQNYRVQLLHTKVTDRYFGAAHKPTNAYTVGLPHWGTVLEVVHNNILQAKADIPQQQTIDITDDAVHNKAQEVV